MNDPTAPVCPSISIQDRLLNDSRLSPNGNGNPDNRIAWGQRPTNGQKWWAAVIFGFIFGLISSPAAYAATATVTTGIVGLAPPMKGRGPTTLGLFIQSLVFILVIRLILW